MDSDDPQLPPRIDGFGCPSHPFQLGSWVLYLLFVCTFYTLFLFPLDDPGRLSAGIVYGCLAALTLLGALRATGTNPADPLIYTQPTPAEAAELHWCYRCVKNVQPSSKHCTICRKCVDVFDHHCVWLNNCVGRQNIVPFYALLAGAGGMLAVQIAVGAYSIYAFTTPLFEQRLQAYLPGASPVGALVGMLLVWVVTIAAEGLVLQLLSFHSVLVMRDLTTYDFIVQRGQERNGMEVVPGHGSSVSAYCKGHSKRPSALQPVPAHLPPQPPPAQQQQQPTAYQEEHGRQAGLELRGVQASTSSVAPAEEQAPR